MTEDVGPDAAGPMTDEDLTRRADGAAEPDAYSAPPVVLVGPGAEAPMVEEEGSDRPAAEATGGETEPVEPGSPDPDGPPPLVDVDATDVVDEGARTSRTSEEIATTAGEPTPDEPAEELVAATLDSAPSSSAAEATIPAAPAAEVTIPTAPAAEAAPVADVAVELPAADVVVAAPLAVDADGPLEEESPLDDLTWDAIAVALATEPPIPPAPGDTPGAPAHPAAPQVDPDAGELRSTEVEADWPTPDEWPDVVWAPDPEVDDDEPTGASVASPDGSRAEQAVSDQAMSDQAMSDQAVLDQAVSDQAMSDQGMSDQDVADDVADFWNQPPPPPPSPPPPSPQSPSPPSPPVVAEAEDADADAADPVTVPLPPDPEALPEPLVAAPWPGADDPVGVEGLAADWMRADADRSAGTWQGDEWGNDDRPPRRRDRIVAPLAGRWSTMRRAERVNVVLYVLTGVSILAMALELLAGPDSLPTNVSTAPPPAVSTPTTARPATTVTFTIPEAQAQPRPAPGPETAGTPAAPAAPTPTAAPAPAPTPAPPAPEPEPEPEPVVTTAPPQTTPTTRPTPTTNPGFPEPTPPVLPTFPGSPIGP